MPTLNEVLQSATDLAPAEVEWLQLLVGDWQLISDLSFGDLVLWVPGGLEGWLAVAHVRPTTGQMVFFEDVVGRRTHRGRQSLLDQAYLDQRIVREKDPIFRDDMPVREEAIPVVRQGRALAVITRHTNLAAMRTPSRLELTYQALADAMARMIAAGEFPNTSAPTGQRRGAPRVGDGVIRLDVNGIVSYASPNALSAVHRLGHVGDVIGELLAKVVADLLRDEAPVDESLALVVTGRAPWRTEVTSRGASVSMRAIPLTEGGNRIGALLLLRDVSELRRRELELLTKDATIREIHHRVKNNLQTVAALLRLQARRLPEGEAGRVALEEAVRRVGVIALVHETLSQGFDETVDFDDIAVRGLQAITEVAKIEHPISSQLHGSFGTLRAEDATALAMVLSELIQNAVEHGLAETGGGTVEVTAQRSTDDRGDELLTVTITDDGAGLPGDFKPGGSGLGTQIVQSLVQDLRGRISWDAAKPRGTRVRFIARLRPLGRDGG
ncbi:Two-component sensor histidine kinase, contains HisKA and HATPase domains [Pedococcus dokdonensis]|uniref:histidine kinase n=1 Tax=Pedococcus dokdonensis TaxID=443156 RepID=A0A1H0R4S6_9MICO|nr:sensor histidine kinase [Pedococcus dokdonensis]SDP24523.1 Two-component sensor histidine kinase, contains HisKA and HATPase domains [Pedococcus dokdonensis]